MTVAAMPARSRPYFCVDVLDHLLAPLMLEIDVDVGRLAALLGDEALEQQIAGRRIDRGDAEAVADGAVRRRAAPLAQDRRIEAAREGDDVVDGQEIAREVELLDQLQLVVELRQHLVRNAVGPALAWRPPRSDAPDTAAASGPPAPSRCGYSYRSSSRLKWSASANSRVAEMACGQRANSRAISAGDFRCRSALGLSR